MNDLDRRLDAILREETAVGPRTLPAGTERRIARRHTSLVAATWVGVFAGVVLLVAALGPLSRGSASPSVVPASEPPSVVPVSNAIAAPAGYERPVGWPRVHFTTTQEGAAAVLAMTNPSMKDPVAIAGGTVDGIGFGFVSYEPTASDPDLEGTCASVMVDPIADPLSGVGSSIWCTGGFVPTVPADGDLMDVGTNFEATPKATFETVHAIVSHRVVAVRATMDDGTVAVFPTIPGPPGAPFDQAIFFPPIGTGGRIQALAADGTVLDHASVCVSAEMVATSIAEGDDAWVGCGG
jgi:hypothetical protein